MHCPTCGSVEVEPLTKGSAPYPLAIVAVFGLGVASLHQLSWPVKYRCAKCGLDFRKRAGLARVAGLVLIAFLTIVALSFVEMILRYGR